MIDIENGGYLICDDCGETVEQLYQLDEEQRDYCLECAKWYIGEQLTSSSKVHSATIKEVEYDENGTRRVCC
jgi:hypothetical protein